VGWKDISESLFPLKRFASRLFRRLRIIKRMMAMMPAIATTAEAIPIPTLKEVFWVVGMAF